ncbi:MAG: RDD family protein [Proteobacteria bacterium]|nr:RDD family protein [Pseudomonadota bacterium]
MGDVVQLKVVEKEKIWFFLNGNHHEGPFSESEMKELIESKMINQDVLVWKEGMISWVALRQTTLSQMSFVPPSHMTPRAAERRETIPASIKTRGLAFAIDIAILAIPNVLTKVAIAIMLGPSLSDSLGFEKAEVVLDAITVVAQIVVWVGYFGLLQARLAGTPGKKLFGLVLVDSDSEGITVIQGVKRSLLQLLNTLFLGLLMVPTLWKKEKTVFYDRISKTDVKRYQ